MAKPALKHLLRSGTRIRLTSMDDDPPPIPIGSLGTVQWVREITPDFTQVDVAWDSGRSLMLSLPADGYEIVSGSTDVTALRRSE